MKLHDESIAHLARIIQMAIITGTDIVDHLRMLDLVEKEGFLVLDEDYKKNQDLNLQEMIQKANGSLIKEEE